MNKFHSVVDIDDIPAEIIAASLKAGEEMLEFAKTFERPDIALTALLSAYTTIALALPKLTAQAARMTGVASQFLHQAAETRPATPLH